MMILQRAKRRRGVVLVFTVLLLVPLIAFVALAIDLGLIAVAKTQAQNSADAAAMAAVRTINGDPTAGYLTATAITNGRSAGGANSILGATVPTANVNIQLGKYYYDRTLGSPTFTAAIPGPTNENWSLAQSTVTYAGSTYFAKALGINGFNVTATATAVHRPRDIALIMDFSGSMRFDSLVAIPYTGTRTSSNNPETVYPTFGHYSGTTSLYNGNASTSLGGEVYGSANITVANSSGSAIVDDFYKHASLGMTPVKAFTAQPASYATTPAGDVPAKISLDTGATYATDVGDLIYGTASETLYSEDFETKGYDHVYAAASKTFQGYTLGPKYWGKTFFIWPPDPRAAVGATPAKDWRKRFFIMRNTGSGVSQPLDDNSLLWSNGAWRTIGTSVALTGGTFRLEINYDAILSWLKETPSPFPTVLRAGRILYYDAIPSTLSNYNFTNFPPTWPDTVDLNQRFWKEYIDYVIGVEQTTSGSSYTNIRTQMGYGDDFAWGTVSSRAKPVAPTDTSGSVNFSTGYSSGYTSWITVNKFAPVLTTGLSVRFGNHSTNYRIVATQSSGNQIQLQSGLTANVPNGTLVTVVTPSMDYRDSPNRPKMRLWFGPLSLIDYLGNYNRNRFWWPGTAHEAPVWQAKIGTQAALRDMKNNHPNDDVSLIFFSSPKQASTDTQKRFNRVRAPLGKNYDRLVDSLWFPLTTIDNPGTEIRPYGSSIEEVPKAMGGTCYPIALMLAYNQFSNNQNLVNYASSNGIAGAPAGDAGGLGRRGSQRLIIFQTDGMVNVPSTATYTNNGVGQSYYNIRQPTEFPTESGDQIAQTNALIEHICALETAAAPGYSTTRKPVLCHCLAFGTLFEPSTTDPDQADALSRLQYMQFIGGKAGGEQPDATTALASYKRIVGTSSERISKMQDAMSRIVQDGVQVSMIK